MALIELRATELLQELASGRVKAVEVTQAFLDQIAKHDAAVGAFLRVDPSRRWRGRRRSTGGVRRASRWGGWPACRWR